jgi:hypothetical protein
MMIGILVPLRMIVVDVRAARMLAGRLVEPLRGVGMGSLTETPEIDCGAF